MGESVSRAWPAAMGKRSSGGDNPLPVSGFGLGIGGAVAIGALEATYASADLGANERVCLRPFRHTLRRDVREACSTPSTGEDMIPGLGFVIFLAGKQA